LYRQVLQKRAETDQRPDRQREEPFFSVELVRLTPRQFVDALNVEHKVHMCQCEGTEADGTAG